MKKRNYLFYALLAIIACGTAGYYLFTHVYAPRKYAELTQRIIKKTIADLGEEKLAGQPIHIAIPGTELNDQARKIIAQVKPGGIIFFGFNLQNAQQIKKLTTDLQALALELSLPPFLISTDQEGGYVKRVQDGVLQTPPAMDIGATGDSELCRASGYFVSRDLGNLGINVFFAPILDINNNPQNPVIGLRSFGTTPDAVLKCALPFEQGARLAMREGGALPVIKHFPGHGDTHTDSHWALPVIDKKIDELQSFELVPFNAAIRDGAKAVMTAHILYPQVDKEHPATLSAQWLTGTLRGEMGFEGLVFTDAMEMNAVSQNFKTLDRPVTALVAGADVLLYTSWQEEPVEAHKRILAAMKAGNLIMGYNKDQKPLPLQRAIENQLRQKLPLMEASRYLNPEELNWYKRYSKRVEAGQTMPPVKLSREELIDRYSRIQWSTRKKKGGPVWLAGKKNSANAR